MLSRRPAPKHRASRRLAWSPRSPLLHAGYLVSTILMTIATVAMAAQVSLWGVDKLRGTAAGLQLPTNSGFGRRIVFDQSEQRVWLVDMSDAVERTYLVSGSTENNLHPGSYRVQSRTRHANAFDASGTMEFFVRFAEGKNAPIGFHTVPVDKDGHLEQSKSQLGTPQSAGCVRQWRNDAIALWRFAPVGTTVVVTR